MHLPARLDPEILGSSSGSSLVYPACSKVAYTESFLLKDNTLLLTNPTFERLREEARNTYFEYGRTRQRYRIDRDDPELIGRLHKLRARYAELEKALSCPAPLSQTAGAWQGYSIDTTNLQTASPRSSRPYNYHPPADDRSLFTRLFNTARRFRVLAALILLLAAFAVIVSIANQDLGFYRVPTSSMEPTLMPNDRLLAYSSESYDRGEVVVVRLPDTLDGYLVKRIVGLSGDVVSVRNGTLIVNGVQIDEPYVKERITYNLGPVTVRAGEVFLLGDNRNQSQDGHIWKRGVATDTIMGAVKRIYSPRFRMRTKVAYRDVFSRIGSKLGMQNPSQHGAPSS